MIEKEGLIALTRQRQRSLVERLAQIKTCLLAQGVQMGPHGIHNTMRFRIQ
jgi:hypothetical protein